MSTQHPTADPGTVEAIVYKVPVVTDDARARMRDDQPRDHDILIRTTASTEDGMRKRAVVDSPSFPGVAWSIACDEGPSLGGIDSAPPPLSYFAAGIAFCLLTQLTRYHEVKKLKVESMRIEQSMRFRRTGSVLAGTFNAEAVDLVTVLDIQADEDPATVEEIVRVGEQMCFAAQAMLHEVPATIKVLLNGEPLGNS